MGAESEDPQEEDAVAVAVAVAAVAGDLYELVPEEFTAARNARVKDAKDKGDRELSEAIAALRKPSTAAWLVNELVRHHGEEVQQLLDLGAALRDAQADLDAEQMKELNRQRQQVVAAMSRQVRALSRRLGHRLSADVERAVEETLRAGLADENAAVAIRSGRLTKAISYAGMGPVEVSDVAAVPSAPASATAQRTARSGAAGQGEQQRARELAKVQEDARAAHQAAQRAQSALAQAAQQVEEITGRRREIEDRAAELEEQLARARTDAAEAARQVGEAAEQRDRAAELADAAQRAAAHASERVQRLTDG